MKKGDRAFVVNRKARFNYEVLEKYEAGLVLLGTEIKAIREGKSNLSDAYARPQSGELWLMNVHIAQYSASRVENYDPTRSRKLLLHKKQISYLSSEVLEKGLTIIPLKLYLKGHRVKVELGLAKGRRLYDKRRLITERDREREARQAIKRLY